MEYKAKFLIDDNDTTVPITLDNAIEDGVDLTRTGSGGAIVWGQETSSGSTYTGASTVHSPYQSGTTGNPSGEYCVIMPTPSNNTGFQNSNIALSTKWCIQFWFRAHSTTFQSGGSQVDNQVLFSVGQSGLPNTTDSNTGLHIVAYKSGTDVDSIKFMKGNGSPSSSVVDVLTAPSCLPTITNNSTWIFVCVTYEVAPGVSPTTGDLKMFVSQNRDGSNTASSRGLSSMWTSFTTHTARKADFKVIPSGHKFVTLGYSGLTGYNQFKGAYSILRIFNGGVPSTTQLNNLYLYNALNGTTYGDVHVIPRIGNAYTFHTPGSYRYFDDNDGFIINVQTDLCKYKRWATNDYITHVYIKTRDGHMLCKTGFRGEKVEVLNSTLEFEVMDCETEETAYAYCTECRYKTTNDDYRKRHSVNLGHYIPEIVRNKVIVRVNTYDNSYKIIMTNVNAQNLQPAQLKLHMTHEQNVHKYSGFTIHEKYSKIMIESLEYDTLMRADNGISNSPPEITLVEERA